MSITSYGCVDMPAEFWLQTEILPAANTLCSSDVLYRDTNSGLLNNFPLLIIPEAIIAGATCTVSGAATPQLENSRMGKRLRNTDTHTARTPVVGPQCQLHNAIASQDLQGRPLHLVACDHILPAARASIMAL